MAERQIKVERVWRSQLSRLMLFLLFSPICVWLSNKFPETVISGPLFRFDESVLMLSLPLLWFVPAYFAFACILTIYDVKYTLDVRGIEAKIGILSLSQSITRIRYEDIRSIDSRQTLTERMLGIGTIEIGTAASAGLEISFEGISNPLDLQKKIQVERDTRLRKAAQKQGGQDFSNIAAAGGE